jgi:hypothetical protein
VRCCLSTVERGQVLAQVGNDSEYTAPQPADDAYGVIAAIESMQGYNEKILVEMRGELPQQLQQQLQYAQAHEHALPRRARDGQGETV